MKVSIKYLVATATTAVLLIAPMPVLAAVNPDAQSAAAAGIQYLANNQQGDGSISGFGGESDWSAEAVQASGQSAAAFAHGGSGLLDFLKSDVPGAGTSTTAIERKIIAIAAAGQNPASFGGVNYESLLEAQHTGGQIGDATLLNDDIFGVIAIDAAHDTSLAAEAQDGLNYLLAHQGADGGFSYTTGTCAWCGSDSNDTAAALVAMYAASDLGLTNANLNAAQSSALNYLLSTQQADGGFASDIYSPSDGSSTAWSLIALNTIGNSVSAQATNARNWLLQNQNADGGFSYGAYGFTSSDTYTTAHAVIALLGTSWLLRPASITTSTGSSSALSGSGGGTASQASPAPAAQTTAAPTNTTSNSAQPAAGQTSSDSADTTSQVKAASTRAAPHTNSANTLSRSKAKKAPGLYGVGLLSLAALFWFVLESRKAANGKKAEKRGGNDGN